MTVADRDEERLRGYLLGLMAGDERESIESDYFARPETLERLCQVEDDLIDDYLSDRLSPIERSAFEGHYLSAPHHRTRLVVARKLREAEASPSVSRDWFGSLIAPGWSRAAVAASLLLMALVTWLVALRPQPEALDVRTPAASPSRDISLPQPPQARSDPAPPMKPPPSATGQPVTLAFSLSAINVRGAGEPATLRIPHGTDFVALQLEGEGGGSALGEATAVVRTVAGTEIWRGRALPMPEGKSLARVDVPAARLRPEDYIVELFERASAGSDVERARYFFRVRD